MGRGFESLLRHPVEMAANQQESDGSLETGCLRPVHGLVPGALRGCAGGTRDRAGDAGAIGLDAEELRSAGAGRGRDGRAFFIVRAVYHSASPMHCDTLSTLINIGAQNGMQWDTTDRIRRGRGRVRIRPSGVNK